MLGIQKYIWKENFNVESEPNPLKLRIINLIEKEYTSHIQMYVPCISLSAVNISTQN